MTDPKNPLPATPPQVDPREQWSDIAGSEHIQHLTSANFEAWMTSVDQALVMFYAPCKKNSITNSVLILVATVEYRL